MTPEFRSQLIVRELDNGQKVLAQDLVFYSEYLNGEVIAPAGSITDYASVPQLFWNLFPKDGQWKWAAVLHDGGYRGTLVTRAGEPMHLIKPVADHLFYEAMIASGVSHWKAKFLYWCVAQFGGRIYGGLGTAQ